MYVIKHTYTETGNAAYLIKGGYVKDIGKPVYPSEAYATERAAKAVATKYRKNDEWTKKLHPSIYEEGIYEVIEV